MQRRLVNLMADRLYRQSVALVRGLEINLQTIATGWVLVAALACGLRVAFPATPFQAGPLAAIQGALPYMLIIAAPLGSLWFGLRLFPAGRVHAQPDIRLARIGRWRQLDCLSVRELSHFGLFGVMASLLLGILLNVPVRTVEFLMSVPALGSFAPVWFISLYSVMLADVVIISSLYMFAFAMALRLVPIFPRFLFFVWCADLVAQLSIAELVSHVDGVPHAVDAALLDLLSGNIKKVLISAAIWLPYLLLSDRINATFRHRVAA